jgi:hypothetical protein
LAALVRLGGRPLHLDLADVPLALDVHQLLAGVLPQLLHAVVLDSQQLHHQDPSSVPAGALTACSWLTWQRLCPLSDRWLPMMVEVFDCSAIEELIIGEFSTRT